MTNGSANVLKISDEAKPLVILSYTLILTLIFIGLSVLTYLKIFIHPPDDIIKNLIFITCSGGLGALAFSMYVFIYHSNPKASDEEKWNAGYFNSYILRPYLGILFGVFVYFFVAGGLMVITEKPEGSTILIFYMALAFLAGYAEEPFALQLKKLAESLFKDPKEKR